MTVTVIQGVYVYVLTYYKCKKEQHNRISLLVGLLVDSQENWSLRTQEGVLVIENDKIIQRTSKENLDEILRKYT